VTNPEDFKDSDEPQDGDVSQESGDEQSAPDVPNPSSPLEGLDPGFSLHETPAESRNLEEREVHVAGVYEQTDPTSGIGSPFVLIKDNRKRCVMIWIGRFEALAISTGLEKVASERPLTHDLLRNITEKLGANIDRVVIDDLWGETFYAKVWIQMDGKTLPVDARPSDAIALAVRAQCPMFMTEAVIEEASKPFEDFEHL